MGCGMTIASHECHSTNTIDGHPCLNPVVPGQDHCHLHEGQKVKLGRQGVVPIWTDIKDAINRRKVHEYLTSDSLIDDEIFDDGVNDQ